jgi:hypothetical protein
VGRNGLLGGLELNLGGQEWASWWAGIEPWWAGMGFLVGWNGPLVVSQLMKLRQEFQNFQSTQLANLISYGTYI